MQSSIKFRPRSFDAMIGQEKIVARLRGANKKHNLPVAMLFTGKKGGGKTSLALIIALSLQCSHSEFGKPCKDCWIDYKKGRLPLYELDCGLVRTVDPIESFIEQSGTEILGVGKKKVFIFDEAHRLSGTAQDSLLKSFENSIHCQWMICTTRPEKIIDTLRSRCRQYSLKPFDRDDTYKLVKKILTKKNCDFAIDDLVDELIENKVDSARLIANAVDEYISGSTAEEAAKVEGVTSVDSKALIRATGKGDWLSVSKILTKTPEGDLRLLRTSIVNYLRTILLESVEIDDRGKTIADAIRKLSYVTSAEDSVQLAVLSAELFDLCKMFSNYQI